VQSFTRGLDLDIQAVTAALTLPHHNGRTEGVNDQRLFRRQIPCAVIVGQHGFSTRKNG
jgi:hypothetical protein